MELRQEIVWGRVCVDNRVYLLLSPKPEHKALWQLDNTLRWLVADANDRELFSLPDSADSVYKYKYTASYLVFGSNAVIEMYDSANNQIWVEFFSDEQDDVVVSPV